MKRHYARILIAVLICILLIAATACSSGSGNSSTSSEAEPASSASSEAAPSAESSSDEPEESAEDTGNITLRVSWWGSDTRTQKTIEFLELYASENPNISFEYEYPEDYATKLLTQAMSGDMPDIPQTDYSYLSIWGRDGHVIDIQPYVDSGIIDLSNAEQTSVDMGITDGKLYGVNNGLNAFVLLYNKRIAEECDIVIEPGYTWEDLYDWSETVFEKTGAKAQTMAHPGDGHILIITHAREMGYYTYNEDGTAFGFPVEIVKDVFEMQNKFLTSGFAVDPDLAVEKGIYEENLITTGEQWFQTTWVSMYPSIQAAASEELEIAVMPRWEGAKDWPNYSKPTNFMSISKDTKYPEECAKVLNFIANSTEVHKILNLDRGVPISTVVQEEIANDPDIAPETAKMMSYFAALPPYEVPVDPPYPEQHANTLSSSDMYGAYLQAFLFGEMGPDEAATAFYEDASAILAGG